jgi:hypothetical protein
MNLGFITLDKRARAIAAEHGAENWTSFGPTREEWDGVVAAGPWRLLEPESRRPLNVAAPE